MSWNLDGSTVNQQNLLMNTIELLDEEKRNILTEVLKCAVCLELPKRKQVLICEKGHHFCSTCHKKLNICGICRGSLLTSRNFVVEELVTNLGPVLGILKNDLPRPELPSKLTSGLYQCQHQCSAKTPAHAMIPHLRSKHPDELIENKRSNPYTSQFAWSCNINFVQNENYILSISVSDMGLFTIFFYFQDSNFLGFVKMLGDKSVSLLYKYQMTLKISSKKISNLTHQFSVLDSPVASYYDDFEAISQWGNFLKVKGIDLLEYINQGDPITVFFSIEKLVQVKKKKTSLCISLVPNKPLVFSNDRKFRRNKNRNIRRKKCKEKYRMKNGAAEEKNMTEIVENFMDLSVNQEDTENITEAGL